MCPPANDDEDIDCVNLSTDMRLSATNRKTGTDLLFLVCIACYDDEVVLLFGTMLDCNCKIDYFLVNDIGRDSVDAEGCPVCVCWAVLCSNSDSNKGTAPSAMLFVFSSHRTCCFIFLMWPM